MQTEGREANDERAANVREGKRSLGGSSETDLSFLHAKGYSAHSGEGDGAAE